MVEPLLPASNDGSLQSPEAREFNNRTLERQQRVCLHINQCRFQGPFLLTSFCPCGSFRMLMAQQLEYRCVSFECHRIPGPIKGCVFIVAHTERYASHGVYDSKYA